MMTEAAVLERPIIEDIELNEVDQDIEGVLTIRVAVQTELFRDLISKVERSVAKKAVQDIYKTIFIDFQSDKIIVRAINNDFTIEAIFNQNEEQTNYKITSGSPGSICFPADKLVQIVKRLKTKNIEIEVNENKATFRSGKSTEFKLHGLPGNEFPSLPSLTDSISTLEINPHVLSELYNKTAYAASASEGRPILTGVFHRVKDGVLACIATDSHRLTRYVHELNGEHKEIDVTIPTPVIEEAKKHMKDLDDDVIIHLYEHYAVYVMGDVTIYGRLLEGNYPETSRIVFPDEQVRTSFKVRAKTIKEVLNNATVYSTDYPIIIYIKPELNQFRAISEEPSVGLFKQDVVLQDGQGEDIAIAVNIRYLQETFSRYSDEDIIEFKFLPSTKGRPVGLQPFRTNLAGGNTDCTELFLPVKTPKIHYEDPVVIEDFEGAVTLEDFNPFEEDFEEIS